MNQASQQEPASPKEPSAEEIAERAEEQARITAEEERVLSRVRKHLEVRRSRRRLPELDYDAELLALRDQINEARLEDVPPLIEEMERLQAVAQRRAKVTEGYVDPSSPYFGRLVLEEDERKREVLIGRSTYLDAKTGVRIVDWRDAPISRLYYRYEEGDEYEEHFGGREVEGEIVVRRSLAISDAELRRIGSPQGTFVRRSDGRWMRLGESARRLSGGQGTAMRAEAHHQPGKLGTGGDGDGRLDRHLPEITALIDPRQFDLITSPSSGLVVIQGGAGSGKTTIGLHRLAYLSYQSKRGFRPERMLVVVFNDALRRYISRVLPALGVPGVRVATYERWAQKLRQRLVPGLTQEYEEDTPQAVTRLKKHPVMLELIDAFAERLAKKVEARLAAALEGLPRGGEVLRAFAEHRDLPLAQRLEVIERHVSPKKKDPEQLALGQLGLDLDPGPGRGAGGERDRFSLSIRHAVERVAAEGKKLGFDLVGAWSEILTDLPALTAALDKRNDGALSETELRSAHRWCTERSSVVAFDAEERAQKARDQGPKERSQRREREERKERKDKRGHGEGRDGHPEDHIVGIDGLEEKAVARLDVEDDALLLRLAQRLRGPLTRSRGREALIYDHILIDEAQDLSPVELAVLMETASEGKSVTLAGDVAQRLLMDNGFTNWEQVLGELGLSHVAVEPLRISYRSTQEIIELARDVLGPLAHEEEGRATRSGAPVELFPFTHSGEAVAFLGEALRELMGDEPRCTVALIARYPEHADLYYQGLKNAEVPYLRRIAEQDFPFKPGIDVTDVRQVKGLEFDYVILLEVGAAVYPPDDEARHLLHIAATRAAHQLWITCVGRPSGLLPEELRERSGAG